MFDHSEKYTALLAEPQSSYAALAVMNIAWDCSYYQPWSDNEWLVDEMITMREETLMVQNENITKQ